MSDSYRIIKGILSMEGEEATLKIFLYVLYGDQRIYTMSFRPASGKVVPVGLNTEWMEFASYVESSWKESEDPSIPPILEKTREFFEEASLKDLYEGSRDGERRLEQRFNEYVKDTAPSPLFAFFKVQKGKRGTVRDFLKQFDKLDLLGPPEGEAEEPEDPGDAEKDALMDLVEYIACAPVIDPIHGKNVSSLSEGSRILVKLAPDSRLYKILTHARKGHFDGMVPATVLRMEEKSSDRHMLEMGITDKVRGLMILQKNLRLKMDKKEEPKAAAAPKASFFSFIPSSWAVYIVGALVFAGVGMGLFWLYRYLFIGF